jgi:microcystin degradation protein MlrC
MRDFVDRMQALEAKDGILSVSLAHGFPWGDVPDNSAKVLVVADGSLENAQAMADELGAEFWSLRTQVGIPSVTVEVALEALRSDLGRPIILADMADNPGGGAPGDSTFILEALINRGVGRATIGAIWDIGAVQICRAAGVGAKLSLRLGGKCGIVSGSPVDVEVAVMAFDESHWQTIAEGRMSLGPSAWVRTRCGVDIVISSIRNQIMGRDAFTNLGITLEDKLVIAVKSAQHFRPDFEVLGGEILYVSTPGAVNPDFANIPFTHRSLDYWPRTKLPGGDPAQKVRASAQL